MSSRPLDQHRPLASREAVAVAIAVASALGELHEAGLVHGELTAHRVLLDGTGEVSLLPADQPVPGEAEATDDVAALGAVLAWLAERAPDRPSQPRAGLLRPAHPTEVLAEMAHRCRAPEPADRPSAKAVADNLLRRLPEARLPEVGDDDARPARTAASPGRRRRPARSRPVAIGFVAAIALGAATTAPTCGTSTAGARSESWTVASTPSPDGIVTVGPHRYAVGAPGDHVLVDRWGCGAPSVALLRADTGDVVAFPRLPHGEQPVVGRVLAQIDGAERLLSRRTARGCAVLAVARADGPTIPVPWEEPS